MFDPQEILQLSAGIDEHLRKLEAFTSQLREIKISLDEIRHSQERRYSYELELMKRHLFDLKDQLHRHGLPQTDHYEQNIRDVRNMLEGNEWPEAVPEELICKNDDEKSRARAAGILDLLVAEHLKSKRFLDYGCGQGHVIPQALEREASFAFGYDVNLKDLKFSAERFTSNFEEVKKNAPYDIILIHDVLDHITVVNPIEALLQAKSVLSNNGRVYVRNHPWSSRHGGHLYMQKNKGFLHLVCDSVELMRMNGLQCEHNIQVVTPLETYRYWFQEAGFKVISEIPIRDKVEDFFLKPGLINERLRSRFEKPDLMGNHLEISFVEYTLESINSNEQIF